MEHTEIIILDYVNSKVILTRAIANEDCEEVVQEYCEGVGIKLKEVSWMAGEIALEW